MPPRSYNDRLCDGHATVDVGKSEVFSFATGHTHEVEALAIAQR
jgi:hypothetical protein